MILIESKNWDAYARKYHKDIVSPFQKGVDNPIFKTIDLIKNKNKLVAADIGCGPGDLLSFLCSKFKIVHALDFSKEMLNIARKRNKKNNIVFEKADMRKLSSLNLKLDVAISVNSIMFVSFEDIDKSLDEIYNSLKNNGIFIGIFPSMEAIIHHAILVYERELKKDKRNALSRAKKITEIKKYCFVRGIYDDGEKQKFFYEFELLERLKETGFKDIKISKVIYPWGKQGDYENFPGKPEMWDWFVSARK